MKDLNKKLEKMKKKNMVKERPLDTSIIVKHSENEIKPIPKQNYSNELKRGVKYKGRKITRL
jgi:hypothetical protein